MVKLKWKKKRRVEVENEVDVVTGKEIAEKGKRRASVHVHKSGLLIVLRV